MSATNNRPELPDLSKYEENRANFPLEEVAKYAGLHVAFSADGTRIVASGKDWEDLWKNLQDAGISPSQVVGSYVMPSDTALLL